MPGKRSVSPMTTRFGLSMSFAFASAGTVVRCLVAISASVSPGRTVYEIMLTVERASTGEGVRPPPRRPKAASVAGPKIPSVTRRRERWKRLSAAFVDAPK